MSVTLTVESRVVAYTDTESLPHVFASVSIPVPLDVLDDSQLTVDTISEAIALNTQQLDDLFESMLVEDKPYNHSDTLVANDLDANALRLLLGQIDQGKVRILASHTSKRLTDDPVWYCVKVKRVPE